MKPTCAVCGGDNVLVDAYAEWFEGAWVLHSTYDAACCEDCDHIDNVSLNWVEEG